MDAAHRPATQPVASQAPATEAPPPSAADELAKFARLRDQGVISEDEFQEAKARILGSLTPLQ